ncbi:hypothetical protein [Dongia sp. agr-C8]
MRAYPVWALVILLLGWTIVAATLAFSVDLLRPALTGDVYGRGVMVATTGAVATVGIALGLALIAIAGSGRRDAMTGGWKLWAKLLLVLGGALCVSISLLMVAAGQFGSVFAGILLFYGWIPILFGALLILAGVIWGRRR